MYRCLLAAGALALVAITLTGCGSSDGPEIPPIGSFYIDASLFNVSNGNFAGLRVVSSLHGKSDSSDISLIGTDDGTKFWNVAGKWTDKDKGELIAYFSHESTPGLGNRAGTLSDSGISWNASDFKSKSLVWKPLKTPGFEMTDAPAVTQDTIGGFYKDSKVYKKGTFAGTRMIGANFFPDLTFVGSDDGSTFWTIVGRWDGPSGQFIADFTPIGGKNSTGKINANTILWNNGEYWAKQTMKEGAKDGVAQFLTV